jgi:hypothetical protein
MLDRRPRDLHIDRVVTVLRNDMNRARKLVVSQVDGKEAQPHGVRSDASKRANIFIDAKLSRTVLQRRFQYGFVRFQSGTNRGGPVSESITAKLHKRMDRPSGRSVAAWIPALLGLLVGAVVALYLLV